MNNKLKDTDLREALRRKYANTPQLSADFMAGMEQRMEAKPRRRINGWLLRVACLLILIGVGTMMLMEDKEPLPSEPCLRRDGSLVAMKEPSLRCPPQTHSPLKRETAATKPTVSRKETTSSPGGNNQFPGRKLPAPYVQTPALEPEDEAINLHYAADVTQEDTTAYQDPALIDDFIAKLAALHHVKQGELNCGLSVDSNMVSAVYVFPDKKEIDLFARLLQVACWYHLETPGYFLNFSQRQFIFQLQDHRKQLKYSWIAERIGSQILLYGTNAPIGAEFSTACYQEYRDQLMNKRSINTKTIDI